MKPIKLWAIVDTQNKSTRYCYADKKKTKGTMAIYDKKPIIPDNWKHIKKVIRVIVSPVIKSSKNSQP